MPAVVAYVLRRALTRGLGEASLGRRGAAFPRFRQANPDDKARMWMWILSWRTGFGWARSFSNQSRLAGQLESDSERMAMDGKMFAISETVFKKAAKRLKERHPELGLGHAALIEELSKIFGAASYSDFKNKFGVRGREGDRGLDADADSVQQDNAKPSCGALCNGAVAAAFPGLDEGGGGGVIRAKVAAPPAGEKRGDGGQAEFQAGSGVPRLAVWTASETMRRFLERVAGERLGLEAVFVSGASEVAGLPAGSVCVVDEALLDLADGLPKEALAAFVAVRKVLLGSGAQVGGEPSAERFERLSGLGFDEVVERPADPARISFMLAKYFCGRRSGALVREGLLNEDGFVRRLEELARRAAFSRLPLSVAALRLAGIDGVERETAERAKEAFAGMLRSFGYVTDMFGDFGDCFVAGFWDQGPQKVGSRLAGLAKELAAQSLRDGCPALRMRLVYAVEEIACGSGDADGVPGRAYGALSKCREALRAS